MFICYAVPPRNCKEQLSLHLLQKMHSKTIFVCISAKWPCTGAMWIVFPDFWAEFWKVNFERWISWGWIFLGVSFAGKKQDQNIWPKNSDPKFENSFPRIRPQIRVLEVRNPLCRNLSLTVSVSAMKRISGPKKPWQPQTWQVLTRFSPLDFSLLSPDFKGLVLLNCT